MAEKLPKWYKHDGKQRGRIELADEQYILMRLPTIGAAALLNRGAQEALETGSDDALKSLATGLRQIVVEWQVNAVLGIEGIAEEGEPIPQIWQVPFEQAVEIVRAFPTLWLERIADAARLVGES